MANGQRFDARIFTAACRSVPLGSRIRVFNLENGKFVDATVTDRGPNSKLRERILDLSEAAAKELGYTGKGLTLVFFTPLPETGSTQVDIPEVLTGADFSTGNLPTHTNGTN